MTATIVLVVFVVVAAAAAIVMILRTAATPAPPNAPGAQPLPATEITVIAPAQREAVAAIEVAPAPPIGWPALVTDDATQLDAAARIRLLADLGIVRAPWCIPVVLQACDEERDPEVRSAALRALGAFRNSAEARAALERVASDGEAHERELAAAALQTFAPRPLAGSNGTHRG